MAIQTPRRQRDRRYSVLCPAKAFIEFSHGRRDWQFPLLDLSISGISFVAENEVTGLRAEVRLESLVHVGDCEIHGHVILRHVTEQPDLTVLYGGVFYPAEEGDLLKLNGVLAGIDTITTR